MTKKELKQKLIAIRHGVLITPILEDIWKQMICSHALPEGKKTRGRI